MFEFRRSEISGGKGIRTPDLLIANETLYQLSYTPEDEDKLLRRSRFSSSALPAPCSLEKSIGCAELFWYLSNYVNRQEAPMKRFQSRCKFFVLLFAIAILVTP